MHNGSVQTRLCPNCPLCGSFGNILYRSLSDRIFGAPGVWDMKKCGDLNCGTLWLDPMPVEADLAKLYANYYTHEIVASPLRGGPLSTFLARVRAAHLKIRYGYGSSPLGWTEKLLGLMTSLHPVWNDALEASVFYLPIKSGGRLLEVGCGSGLGLQSMQEKGWSVTGVDFDLGAVDAARGKGLDVRHGQLSALAFADESFDAVVMSHVIEHVPSPIELLRECRRVLKDNGVVIALTPNAKSRGHRRYARHWRGLEPPRHLQIFTEESLAGVARRAGFNVVKTFTSMNGFVYQDLASADLAERGAHIMNARVAMVRRILSHMKGLGLGWLHVLVPGRGEEVVLVARK